MKRGGTYDITKSECSIEFAYYAVAYGSCYISVSLDALKMQY